MQRAVGGGTAGERANETVATKEPSPAHRNDNHHARGSDCCGTENNFRFLGGELPERFQILRTSPAELTDAQKPLYKQAFADFQPYSIPSTAMDGYVLGDWQRYQALVDGGLIRVWADGRLSHEVTDPNPLTRGRFGLRNFMAGTSDPQSARYPTGDRRVNATPP